MVKRCASGHYYDGDRFPSCPYCDSADMDKDSNVTVSMGGVEKMFSDTGNDDSDMKTVKLEQIGDSQPQVNFIDDDDDATIPISAPSMFQQPVQPPVQTPEPPVQIFTEDAPVMNDPFSAPEKNSVPAEDFTAPAGQFAPPAVPQQMEPQVMPAPAVTAPVQTTGTLKDGFSELVNNAMKNPAKVDDAPTVSVYGSRMKSEPTVGWLIGLNDPYLGECFELRTGKNFIGRGQDMDIVLASDTTVSRYRHAVVLYEPKSRMFLAQPGDSRELFYINDQVVLNNQPLEAYDKLTIGETKLMFFPLCSSEFSWDDVQKED